MNFFYSSLVLGFLAATGWVDVQAQAGINLKEMVVTATRVAQPVTDVVADVSIIDREQIERMGGNTVAQILAQLPGVQTAASSFSQIYLRGAESRMTALYLDGVRVDSQDGAIRPGGGVPWELIPVSQIDRIEVLRGPASAVYGSDAMGGVVQIFTRRGEAGATPFANLGLGSFNRKLMSAGVTGVHEAWDYALSIGQDRSNGFNTRPDVIHSPDREGYKQNAASLRLGFQSTPGQRWELTALDNQLDSRDVPYFGGIDYKSKASLSTTALKWGAKWNDSYSTNLQISSSAVATKIDSPSDFKTQLQGVLFENRLQVAGGVATAVFDQRRDQFDSKATLWDPAFSGERKQNAMGLGYGTIQGQHSVQLNARHDDDSKFGTHQTGSIAYAYAFTSGWRFTMSSGAAFRAPTLEQVYGPYGSTQLKPETNRSEEIGVAYRDRLSSFKVITYQNAITNMISSSQTLTTCSASFFCYYNVGQASIKGLTLSATNRINQFDLRASMDLLDPRDDTTGKYLILRARRVMTLGADRQHAGWGLGAEVQAVGQRFDYADNHIVLPGYFLLNLRASKQLDKNWKLVTRVDNLADVTYQQVDRYATPGRTFYVGLQWQASN